MHDSQAHAGQGQLGVVLEVATYFLESGRRGAGAAGAQLVGCFAEPPVFIFRKVNMSIAAFLTHSVRSRVEVLTSKEFTTVARSLHAQPVVASSSSSRHATKVMRLSVHVTSIQIDSASKQLLMCHADIWGLGKERCKRMAAAHLAFLIGE